MSGYTSTNAFVGDLYQPAALMQSFERAVYVPQMISDLGIFEPLPIAYDTFPIEYRNQRLSIALPVPGRFSPPHGPDVLIKGRPIPFTTIHFKETDSVNGESVWGVRQFGTDAMKTEEAERDYRVNLIAQKLAFSRELSRLSSALTGKVRDASGAVWCDFFQAFDLVDPGFVTFDPYIAGGATGKSGEIRQFFSSVVRAQAKTLGVGSNGYRRLYVCGPTFFDRIVNSVEVRQTYLNQIAAADLRTAINFNLAPGSDANGRAIAGTAAETFTYAGGVFMAYEGELPDGSTLVGDDECYIVPYGLPGMAVEVMAPPSWAANGDLGDVVHMRAYPTDTSGMGTTVLAESHYLPVYLRPEAVVKITAGLGAGVTGLN